MDKNILLTILVVGLVLVSSLLAINKNPIQEKNIISVSGQSKVITEPDKAEVYVKIYTEGTTATEAKDENARISDNVINSLKKYVDKDNIETSRYSLNLKQKWDRDKEEYITIGYELTNILKVTTENIKEAGLLVDTSVNNGANGIERIEFGLTNEKQKLVNAEALEKASLEAKSKAESIAKSMNLKLGMIHKITESNYYFTQSRYDGYDMAVAESAPKAATEISPGEIEVSASISVEYLI